MINNRRGFLKAAGTGLGAGALVSVPQAAIAENVSGGQRQAVFSVTDFGAKGDGRTLDSDAINSAIEAASRAGGGIILFPAGSYLSYSLHLRSNVTLHLPTGSTIVAAPGPQPGEQGKYDLAEPNAPWEAYQDFGHNHWHNSLIWGEGIENVAITGSGMIWGKGLSRGWDVEPRAEHPGAGNKAIALKNCRNVLLRDFAILHGGHFGILATGVDNFTIDNLTIDTNRDGMDIDCCRNVHVSNCTVNSPWDDGICLKSSYALGYARATEMVTITNCIVTGDFEEGTVIDATFKHFAPDAKIPRTGRIKFGTESNGGFKNIAISNCVFDGCRGLAIETVDGAIIEDISVTNLSMRDIREAPIFIRLGARMRGPEGVAVGVVRRVNISNVVCTSAAGQKISSILSGIPGHALEDIRITGITVLHHGGGSASDAVLSPPENEKKYPEPNMFGTTPSHGFFIRHVNGLEMSSVKIESAADDARPAFVLDDVQGADFRFLKLPKAENNTFLLKNVREFSAFRSKPVPDTELAEADRRL
ncbi:MAG TPA: glycoside hydrolase family 28 protein [Terriglobales bacterium]|jgi:polygalacturonase|nr:glycoside hydrolase family 28 protein [Terriglobales bacterium]